MTISTRCPSCGKQFILADDQAGKKVTCLQCGHTMVADGRQDGEAQKTAATTEAVVLMPARPATSYLAVVSLLLSMLLCLGFYASVPAVVVGVIALVRIRRARTPQRGAGMAVVAICVGLCSLIFQLILLPAMEKAPERAREAVCRNSLGEIGKALQQYVADSGGYYPYDPRGYLYSLALLYPAYLDSPTLLRCPSDRAATASPRDCSLAGAVCSYEYVPPVKGETPENVPLMMDLQGNHKDGRNVLFADHKVDWVPKGGTLRSGKPKEPPNH
jgi:predicted Zn finger-like uncharacterized protein